MLQRKSLQEPWIQICCLCWVINECVPLVQMSHAELQQISVFLNVSLQYVSVWQGYKETPTDINIGISALISKALNINHCFPCKNETESERFMFRYETQFLGGDCSDHTGITFKVFRAKNKVLIVYKSHQCTCIKMLFLKDAYIFERNHILFT